MTQEASVKTQPERIDKGDIFLEKVELEGAYKGLHYWVAQVKTADVAIKRYGGDVVVALVNQGVNVSSKNKAKAQLTGESTTETSTNIEERINSGELELLSQEEAEALIPGTREVSSLSGFDRKIDSKVKEYRKAKAENRLDDCKRLAVDIKALKDQREVILLSEVDGLLGS